MQTPPSPTHGRGVAHVPFWQAPEQHSVPAAHVWPSALQVAGGLRQWPLEQTPVQHWPFAVQVAGSVQPVGGVVATQKKPATGSAICSQRVPVQQERSPAPEHAPPRAVHCAGGAAQRSTPCASGTQGAMLQHWSRNWQTSPWAMQHGAVPV